MTSTDDTSERGPVRRSSTTAFAGLFLLTTSCRTLVLSVIPLQAFELLGSARVVSTMFLVVSFAGVAGSLLAPQLVLRLRTRGVFHLAAAVSCVGAIALGLPGIGFFIFGVAAWTLSGVGFEITMNLYILHRIRRREMGWFEPKRVLFMVISYSTGPWLGIYLESRVWHWAPYLMTVVMAIAAIAYFRWLGLGEAGARERFRESSNPLRHVRRFFSQPRLRLAWAIAFARTSWWGTYFIYVPIYAVTVGLGDMVGGGLVSGGVAMVYTVSLWGAVARRHGTRALLVGGFLASAAASMVAAAAGAWPWLAAGCLLVAALVTASLDGAGNVAFLRAVRPFEREPMTGVFGTYRDASQILPPAVFAVVLGVAPVQAVFAVASLWMLVMAGFSRHIPRRL